MVLYQEEIKQSTAQMGIIVPHWRIFCDGIGWKYRVIINIITPLTFSNSQVIIYWLSHLRQE
jgi:hypothetical protein